MKVYNFLCLLAIGLFSTTYSQANINVVTLDWGDTVENNSAFIGYIRDYDPDSTKRSITLTISHDKNGIQRFYIISPNTGSDARCNIYSKPDTSTMSFNGQAVKMNRFCNKFTDTSNTYYSYTPSTEKGQSFIINLFKTSTAPIELTFDDGTLYVPVKGFTKIWNSAGGNAI